MNFTFQVRGLPEKSMEDFVKSVFKWQRSVHVEVAFGQPKRDPRSRRATRDRDKRFEIFPKHAQLVGGVYLRECFRHFPGITKRGLTTKQRRTQSVVVRDTAAVSGSTRVTSNYDPRKGPSNARQMYQLQVDSAFG